MKPTHKLMFAQALLVLLLSIFVAAMLPRWLRLIGSAAAEIQQGYEATRADSGIR